MNSGGQALSGRCLCGAVTFTAAPERLEMDVCHCDQCRRWSGGVFMAVPCSSVSIGSGEAVGVFRSSDWAERVFCRTCGTSLFWRLQEGGGPVAVALQAFDDISVFSFTEEIFIDKKPALYEFAGSRKRLTGAEAMAAFSGTQEG